MSPPFLPPFLRDIFRDLENFNFNRVGDYAIFIPDSNTSINGIIDIFTFSVYAHNTHIRLTVYQTILLWDKLNKVQGIVRISRTHNPLPLQLEVI